MCSHYIWLIIQRFFNLWNKTIHIWVFMHSLNNRVLIFSLHKFLFPPHLPTCDVNHRMQTMTKDNVHQMFFESMVIYPNGHNLWFGSSIYCYFDMIFTKILIKNKFLKATCNHPPFSNCNSIDSKCHVSFHTSASFQIQEPWHHLSDI